MQTSREVIISAIEFGTPDRLPLTFCGPDGSDVQGIHWNQIGTGDRSKRQTLDEWGCTWSRSEVKNMGQITGHPLGDWGDLQSFRWPNPNDPAFYEGVERRLEQLPGDKYTLTSIFMLLFERLHGLRGFENLLTDFYLERENVEKLADAIVEFDLQVIENMARLCPGKIDGFTFTDDWGTETALMISPSLWIEFFKPRYKRIFDKCHECGWHVWMHSCGRINDIIEPLIEIGCNVLNIQQPRALGIEAIGKRFAGRICFEATSDIQHTLPFETDEFIEEEARQLMKHWGTDAGGFILADYGSYEAIGAPPRSRDVMYDAFKKHDRWISK